MCEMSFVSGGVRRPAIAGLGLARAGVLLVALVGVAGVGVGCGSGGTGGGHRTIRVTSEPAGAVVWVNDVEIGRTPVETDFTFFGTYDVRLRLEGYEPVTTSRKADAPLHEWPGFDLAAAVIPFRFETLIEWHFDLEEAEEFRLDEGEAERRLLDRAGEMRRVTGGGLPALEAEARMRRREQGRE